MLGIVDFFGQKVGYVTKHLGVTMFSQVYNYFKLLGLNC